ncbi:MAG: DUF393 domain-containing protein [Phycisphaeraceae bacterium]|nr:DUF393 domain-containing protein [Phycisphaeraceae bacterium]
MALVPAPSALLFDGQCRFCVASTRRLLRLARPGSVVALDSNDPKVMARFPQVSFDEASRAIRLVRPDGRVFAGFEAVSRMLATRPLLRPIAMAYYIPGLRQVADASYRVIAANRHRLGGRVTGGASCDTGACRTR